MKRAVTLSIIITIITLLSSQAQDASRLNPVREDSGVSGATNFKITSVAEVKEHNNIYQEANDVAPSVNRTARSSRSTSYEPVSVTILK